MCHFISAGITRVCLTNEAETLKSDYSIEKTKKKTYLSVGLSTESWPREVCFQLVKFMSERTI